MAAAQANQTQTSGSGSAGFFGVVPAPQTIKQEVNMFVAVASIPGYTFAFFFFRNRMRMRKARPANRQANHLTLRGAW